MNKILLLCSFLAVAIAFASAAPSSSSLEGLGTPFAEVLNRVKRQECACPTAPCCRRGAGGRQTSAASASVRTYVKTKIIELNDILVSLQGGSGRGRGRGRGSGCRRWGRTSSGRRYCAVRG